MRASSKSNSLMAHRSFPRCFSEKVTPIYSNKFVGIDNPNLSHKAGLGLKRGFTFTQELHHSNNYVNYYSRLPKYDFPLPAFKETYFAQHRGNSAIRTCEPNLETTSNLVDKGCGIDSLRSQLVSRSHPHDYGIDPSSLSSKTALEIFSIEHNCTGILSGSASRFPILKAKIAMLTGVMKDLWALWSDLLLLTKEMKSGSYIFVEVPALENFDRKEDEPFGEFFLEHIYFFSAHSLNPIMLSLSTGCIVSKIVELPVAAAESFIELHPDPTPKDSIRDSSMVMNNNDDALVRRYMSLSHERFSCATKNFTSETIFLSSACSHANQFLAFLPSEGLANTTRVVDSNVNDKEHVSFQVCGASILYSYQVLPIMASSFRSQNIIVECINISFPNRTALLKGQHNLNQ